MSRQGCGVPLAGVSVVAGAAVFGGGGISRQTEGFDSPQLAAKPSPATADAMKTARRFRIAARSSSEPPSSRSPAIDDRVSHPGPPQVEPPMPLPWV